jgi:putative membrane protein
MLAPMLKKNDKQAKLLILTVSFVVFAVVASLAKIKVNIDLGFDVHILAMCNAIINSCVSILLVAGFIAVRKKYYELHKNIMLTAIVFSVLFLVCYIAYHLFTGDTVYGGSGIIRYIYLFILITHIILAAVILPFILFTAYRSLTGEYEKHKKIARYTWPLWLYVSVTGVIVYLMISPYYN